jgi:hypothetical protein
MPLRRLFAAVAVLAAPPVAPAGPRDDLLRLVPADYTFCVVVQNLREQSKGEGDNSFLKGIAEHPLMKGLQGTPESRKFAQAIEEMTKGLMVSPEKIRDDLLGDAFVFAYRKGPPGDEGREDILILLHAREPTLLARVVNRVNELQTKSGELKRVDSVGDGLAEYNRRVKAVATEPDDFYALRGSRLAFSGNEALLKSVLPRLPAVGTGDPPMARRMKQLGVNESPVAVLINPRSFDADVTGSAQSGKGSEQAFLKEFASYWKAVDGLAVFVNFRPSVEVGLAINARPADLPKAANLFFAEAGKRSPLWDRIPDDALFAVAGRVHVESMTAMLARFLTDPDRKKVLESIADASRPFLETEEFGPLARGLGPDVGFWVTAPNATAKTWCPQVILAAKIGDGPDGPLAEQAALRGLDFLARLASLQHRTLRVHTTKHGAVEVRHLSHPTAFPPGLRPAFASKGGYIVVADSPETIDRFEPPSGPATSAAEVPVLRISAVGWRKYLSENKAPLAEYLAKMKGGESKDIVAQIDAVPPILEGLDKLVIVQRTGPDRVSVVVQFKELKK